jgi:wobble nucleotide-excising tRNase
MSESVCTVNGNVEAQENESGQGKGPPKTAKQLEKEARREAAKLEKLEKLQKKLDKKMQAPEPTMEKVEVCSDISGNQSCTIR